MTTAIDLLCAFAPPLSFVIGGVWFGYLARNMGADQAAWYAMIGSIICGSMTSITLAEWAGRARLHGNQAEGEQVEAEPQPAPEPQRNYPELKPVRQAAPVFSNVTRGLVEIDPPLPLNWRLMRRFAWGTKFEGVGLAEQNWRGVLTRDSEYKPLMAYMRSHSLARWVSITNHKRGMLITPDGDRWLGKIIEAHGPPPNKRSG